jgi:aminocarboxymuconate-semialdehyde decarboxylase
MLAHSGGALPLLSSRLASCVAHDPHLSSRLQHDVRYYLGKLYYDAVSYGPEELLAACAIVGRAERFRRGGQGIGGGPRSLGGASEEAKKGAKRFHFGTDHPFFPPLGEAKENRETSGEQMPWLSVTENIVSLNAVPGWEQEERRGIMSGNAERLLGLNLQM